MKHLSLQDEQISLPFYFPPMMRGSFVLDAGDVHRWFGIGRAAAQKANKDRSRLGEYWKQAIRECRSGVDADIVDIAEALCIAGIERHLDGSVH